MEPGASWGAWLLWGISVYGSLGLLWMSADPLKESVEKLKSGGRREATDSFQAGLAFAIAGLAALSYLGYRLYVSMW